MNKQIRNTIYAMMVLVWIIPACDVLDQQPETLISNETAIVDLQTAEAALIGTYNALQDGDYYGGRFIMATEMAAGNGRAAAFQQFWKELETGVVPTSNFHVEDNWVAIYNVVNVANSVIGKVPELGLSESDESRLMGTAYFLRGLAFFDALRQYGEFFDPSSVYGIPLPLVAADEIQETSRSTVEQSYLQVETDLQNAIDLLGDSGNKFFASLGAAQALKARVHLYQEEFDMAEQLASAVIANSNYSLSEDYNEVYLSEGSAESIFELNFIALEDPSAWAIEMYITPPEVTVSEDMISFFDPANRIDAERGQQFEIVGSFLRCTKYGSEPADEGGNTILLRLSEMYLIRAEALSRGSNDPTAALADINVVRSRAGLTALTAANVTSESELIDVLLEERRSEFAFEGHYWFDLVRLDRLESTRGLESFRRIFPIPQREINITDGTLVQNPDY
ncbi:MAG: RagB/SusD family nutrient uptake outer membrane protein [Bacteroidota bacterium]